MKCKSKTLSSGIVVENRPDSYLKYCWCIKGTRIFHNEGEPALEYKDGDKYWYQHNNLHRLDGPAIEVIYGNKFYYIDGFPYKEEDYWKHPDVLADQYLKEHPELQGFI